MLLERRAVIKHPSQHFFLQELIDYAGTFPPAGLSLSQALANFRQYQQGLAPSMLGRLICAGSALASLSELLQPADNLLLSVLLSQPEEVALVEEFHARVNKSVRVDTVETAWNEQAPKWADRWNYRLFFEVGSDAAAEAARMCAPQSARLCLKLRTGSVKPEGIPSPEAVVAFLQAAHQSRVGYKFTAGLHHARPGDYALTYEANSPRGCCYGFSSLFGLACLHWHGRLNDDQLLQGLRAQAVTQVDAGGLICQEAHCSAEEIAEYRRLGGRSFGSCSFEEPLQELQEMGWIC